MTTARKYRCVDPQDAMKFWEAVKSIRSAKHIPTEHKIVSYVERIHGLKPDYLSKELKGCVQDGLLLTSKHVGIRGSKVGVEQEGFRIPQTLADKGSHDWYCFECHKPGKVFSCSSCHRVYHSACLQKENKSESFDGDFTCESCLDIQNSASKKKARRELNQLLQFTCGRLKERARILVRSLPLSDDEDSWRAKYFIFKQMDILTMEAKTIHRKYRCLNEFEADARQIVHNIIIYYGNVNPLSDIARLMLRDCLYDITELKQCQDCYRMSNAKNDKYWFCQPCRTPHELVYAKQKGFPYWPAKVIKIEDDQYDVRFFGAQHERALLPKSSIKPITENLQSLQIKKSAAWSKAVDELRHHQELLEKLKTERNGVGEDGDDDDGKSSGSEDMETEVAQSVLDKTAAELERALRKRRRTSSAKTPGKRSKSSDFSPDNGEASDNAMSESDFSDVEDEVEEVVRDEQEHSVTSSSRTKANTKEGPAPEDGVSSSSCQDINTSSVAIQTPRKLVRSLCEEMSHQADDKQKKVTMNKAAKDVIEKLKRDFEIDKQKAVSHALAEAEKDAAALKAQHKANVEQLQDKQQRTISETKKKQWCYNCESEAIYHCCWNTSYCSTDCQQVHWQKEHKKLCRRKR